MIKNTFGHHLVISLTTVAALLALAAMRRAQREGEPTNPFEQVVEVMGRTGLSEADEDELTAGYYESLLDEGQRGASAGRSLLSNLRSIPEPPPDWKSLAETEAARHRADFLVYDLEPNVDIPFKGAALRTNRWGLRDRDYEQRKPEGTYRIALVGSSYTMGSGTPVERTFQALLEEHLNATHQCAGIDRIELINFAVAGHRATQQLDMAMERVPAFEPDLVIFGLNFLAVRPEWLRHIATLVREGKDLKYDFLKRLAVRADLNRSDSPARLASKLAPYRTEVVAEVIRMVHGKADELGARFVILEVPHGQQNGNRSLQRRFPVVLEAVADLRIPAIDILDAFAGVPTEEIWIAAWDNHPNVRGHALMFDAIVNRITTSPELSQLFFQCGTPDGA